ncbi:MAG: type II secretion system F family protein [Candidatus Eutrophobiaceae bacterium]
MAEAKAFPFVWEGKDRSGKPAKGEMSGQSEALVRAMLRRQGIAPLKVKKKSQPLLGGGAGKIVPKDISIFSRQLATMMSAGVPLVQSFEITGRGHENPAMQKMILGIKADIEVGNSLTEALRKHPKQFNDLYCNLAQAGEQAGILETILDKLATYLEKTEGLKSKIKAALFYPTAVVAVGFIIVCVLMVFVIPQFASLFEGFGADLPALTQFLVDTSEFFQSYWLFMIGGGVGTVYGLKAAVEKSKSVQRAIDILSLKMPVLGEILKKSAIARFARTLQTMFAAGTPLVEAMDSVAGACGNALYGDATIKMRDDISTGVQLQTCMSESGLFPNMVVQMVAIGEESGSIDSMLGKVADWYESEVDDAVEAMTSLLEPLIMAFLGVIVGAIVIGMYLPIFKMGSVV